VSGIFVARPYFNFNRSAFAFLVIAWLSGTLYKVDFIYLLDTGNIPSAGINCSKGKAFVDSKRSSKVLAVNEQTKNFTRSAEGNHKLQRAIADTGASIRTIPFSIFTS